LAAGAGGDGDKNVQPQNNNQGAMQTGDAELLRAINRYRVLDAIRRFEPISRYDICERTQLGRTTVSAIIGELIASGVVSSEPLDTAPSGRGRPRDFLRMNPDVAYVVGAKLSMHQVSITVTNLRADLFASEVLPVRTWRLTPEVIADLLEDGIRAAIAKAGIGQSKIAGVGVGIPGFINAATGTSHWSPILGEASVPFAAMLQQRLGIATIIENDANLVTLAERWFGEGQDVDNFVVVTVEGGIGMGLFLGGELFHGHHGIGTEFGHSKIDRDGPLCRCGQNGCIETYVADYAIYREARKLLNLPPIENNEPALEVAVSEVAARARAGDMRLRALYQEAGAMLGLGIANLVNIIDPGKVVVTGSGMRAADLIEPSLRKVALENSLAMLRGSCQIVVHQGTDEVWARGAAALVLQSLFRQPWSDQAGVALPVQQDGVPEPVIQFPAVLAEGEI
jgi:predicted NBD/HSP70 family sugar kinase